MIYPYWERHFIFDSYSCRIGKGTHFGMKRAQKFLRQVTQNGHRDAFALKLDIQSYFTSMNQGLMWQFNKRIFTDDKCKLSPQELEVLRYLLPIIIFARPSENCTLRGNVDFWDKLPDYKSLFGVEIDRGFPIGNLTSQLFSNVYLNELDQFAKNVLRIQYYGRYVDDIIIFDTDPDLLRAYARAIDTFLRTHLLLQLNQRKTHLQSASYPVNFIGGRITLDNIYPGKRLLANYHKLLKEGPYVDQDDQWQARVQSYLGQFRQFAVSPKTIALGL